MVQKNDMTMNKEVSMSQKDQVTFQSALNTNHRKHGNTRKVKILFRAFRAFRG